MNILTKVSEWQEIRKQLQNKTIGFVPTMGNLHQGHLSLCERAKVENEVVVVSIFVNPTQFNDPEDFNRYPRTIENDIALLSSLNVDYVFIPEAGALYPDQYEIKVTESTLSLELEGKYRPGHFDGMLTIVLKLLNLVSPNKAYFGEKDYQQLLLIKKMCDALFLSIKIIACETKRAEDGLALSSRNNRLNADDRAKASLFPAILKSDLSHEQMIAALQSNGFQIDYIADKWQRRLGAVHLGGVRLIDNIPMNKEDN